MASDLKLDLGTIISTASLVLARTLRLTRTLSRALQTFQDSRSQTLQTKMTEDPRERLSIGVIAVTITHIKN